MSFLLNVESQCINEYNMSQLYLQEVSKQVFRIEQPWALDDLNNMQMGPQDVFRPSRTPRLRFRVKGLEDRLGIRRKTVHGEDDGLRRA
jgi:hypothetical protein